jgi:exosortase A-associated hydrolase 2
LRDIATEAFYLPAERGARFCVLRGPAQAPRGAILHVHPFAEELNKSRRTVAEAARALARAGWAVLQVDLAGCGDSSGEFGEATWAEWVDDVARAGEWLKDRYGGVAWLWGLRAGCLVASDALARVAPASGVLLWQPVVSGKQHLTQFLRTKVAGEAIGSGANRATTQDLRDRIAKGEFVEIAGYAIHAALAEGLERAELRLAPDPRRIVWLEVASEPAALAPAAQARVAKFEERGIAVTAKAVAGEPFWQTTEIAECPALVARTVEVLGA